MPSLSSMPRSAKLISCDDEYLVVIVVLQSLSHERRQFESCSNGLRDVVDEIARAIGGGAVFDRLHVRGERTIAEDVLEPAREVVSLQVRREIGVRHVWQLIDELFQRSGARARTTVVREHERLRFRDRHIEVLRAVPDMRG